MDAMGHGGGGDIGHCFYPRVPDRGEDAGTAWGNVLKGGGQSNCTGKKRPKLGSRACTVPKGKKREEQRKRGSGTPKRGLQGQFGGARGGGGQNGNKIHPTVVKKEITAERDKKQGGQQHKLCTRKKIRKKTRKRGKETGKEPLVRTKEVWGGQIRGSEIETPKKICGNRPDHRESCKTRGDLKKRSNNQQKKKILGREKEKRRGG